MNAGAGRAMRGTQRLHGRFFEGKRCMAVFWKGLNMYQVDKIKAV
jgi:hypothetical protein